MHHCSPAVDSFMDFPFVGFQVVTMFIAGKICIRFLERYVTDLHGGVGAFLTEFDQ